MAGRYTPDPSSGGMIDQLTGQTIMPGDPNWQQSWSDALSTVQPGTPWDIANQNNPNLDFGADMPGWLKAAYLAAITAGTLGSGTGPAAAALGGDVADASAGGVMAGLPGAMDALPAITDAAVPMTGADALASGYGAIAGPSAGDVYGGLVGPATGVTGGSTAGNILKGIQTAGGILGKAAGAQSTAEQNADKFNLEAAYANTQLPAQRLASATKAAAILNTTPYKAQWGGPGSGLKGQIVNMTGGPNIPAIQNSVRSLANQVQTDQLNNELAGPIKSTASSGIGDKLLGGTALGTSLMGALLPFLNKTKAPSVPGYVDPLSDFS